MRITIILFFILSGFSAVCQSCFIENKGQVHDLNNQPVSCVKYIYSQGTMNVQLREDGFSYDVFESCGSNNELANTEDFFNNEINTDGSYQRIHRVDVDFYQCNKSIEQTAEQQQHAVLNYYTTGTGEEGVRDVHSYRKITYHEVYDGIDVEFEIHPDRGFEYSFIVKDAGDVNDIQLRYRGQEDMWLDGNELYLKLSMEVLKESIPKSYYTKDGKFVEVHYKLSNDVVSFDTGNDVAMAMIIDPVPELIYASLFGGEAEDNALEMEINLNGDIVIGGTTKSTANIATVGANQQELGSASSKDCYLQLWSAANQLQWSTYFGGENLEQLFGLDLDIANNIVIGGSTNSELQIATMNSYQDALSGIKDGFLAKFNGSGQRIWSTYFGGSQGELIGEIAIFNDRILAYGNTNSINLPIVGAPIQNNLVGQNDVLMSEWSNDGALVWSSYFGAEGNESIYELVIDDAGNLTGVGLTDSESGIDFNGFQSAYGGGFFDLLIIHQNANHELLYSSYFGGSGLDLHQGTSKATNNDILIVGSTDSGEGLATLGAYSPNLIGVQDIFVLRLSENGANFTCTYYGGSNYDEGYDITELSDGTIAVAGYTESPNNISTSDAWQPIYHLPQQTGPALGDGFIAKFSEDLSSIIWSTYIGNYSGDIAWSIRQSGDELLVSGYTMSTADLPAEYQGTFITPDAYQTSFGGDSDAFIARFGNVLGVDEMGSNFSMNMYPNPTKEMAHLNLPHSDNWLLSLYDSKGQVQRMEMMKAASHVEMNVKDLVDGIYVLTAMDTSGKVYVSRVEVQK
jgi:hypothetical protein